LSAQKPNLAPAVGDGGHSDFGSQPAQQRASGYNFLEKRRLDGDMVTRSSARVLRFTPVLRPGFNRHHLTYEIQAEAAGNRFWGHTGAAIGICQPPAA
jgi:hypothetical protein